MLQDQADVLKDDAKYRELIDTLKQSLDIKEDQPYARSALGWSYYGLKQYDEAEEAFNHAIELKSDYADAYYGLGRALQAQVRRTSARRLPDGDRQRQHRAKDALARLK